MNDYETPNVFISYSWEDDNHNVWVKSFSKKLREDGVNVKLDKWELVPGEQITEFMGKSVRENDFVLIICTKKYKLKSDNRKGGVGYEGDIMTAEVFSKKNHSKFIPILKNGDWENSAPTWLLGKYYIDLSTEEFYSSNYDDLITTLFKNREKAPELGTPDYSATSGLPNLLIQKNNNQADLEEIKIKGIIVDEVSVPKNDRTPGSALYKIPFLLNKNPNYQWNNLFVEFWNRPMRYTSMHRPGIAHVIGNKIILDGTTIEEVERYHRDTLIQAVNMANEKMRTILQKEITKKQKAIQNKNNHLRNINDIANKINFDE